MNDELFQNTIKMFAQSKYISTAKIQRIMKVSYFTADEILNKLIENNLASFRMGSYPSILLRGKNKESQAAEYIKLIKSWIEQDYQPDPNEFLK